MPDQLIRNAIEQSRTREPLVHAVALLTSARVLAYVHLAAAKQALAEGLSVFNGISFDDPAAELVRHQIALLAVPVDPEVAVSLYKQLERSRPRHRDGSVLISQLVIHGFTSVALDLFEDLRHPAEGGLILIAASPDPAIQLRVLRAAKARWQLPRQSPFPDDFHRLFSRHFQLLDSREARQWLDELLTGARTLSKDRISADFGMGAKFETLADMQVFELLHATRALKPPSFVEDLLRQYPSVASAAQVYPNGIESIITPPPPANGTAAVCFRPAPPTEPQLDHAQHQFLHDVSTNAAPRVFWPSTYAYRSALHRAGEDYGKEGKKYLELVPDTDIAILAAIDLAGGVIGLRMPQSVQLGSPYRTLSRPSEPGVPVA